MRGGPALAIGSALLAGVTVAFVVWTEPVPEMPAPAPVVFVCRNGVAMSVWSAAYFNRLAAARGIRERAISRASLATFTDVPLHMRLALALDGFRLDGYRPHVVSADDTRHAELIVTIDDAVLPPETNAGAVPTAAWQGFPPMREEYFPSRRALKDRIEELVERFGRSPAR